MQYLRGKMMAVTSAARREMEARQGMAVMQEQPDRQVIKKGEIVSDLPKRNITETEESGEVKRIKINPAETKLQMENIVDEEWKRMSLGIEKQARSVQLKATEANEAKISEFGSELKRTIINKPSSESKPTGSKTVTDSQQKKIIWSDSAAPRTKQDHALEKSREKRRRWDDSEESGKGRKYDDDDKRSRQKQSPSHRSTKTPPRSYRSKRSPSPPPSWTQLGRRVWSLKDDKPEKYSSAGKDAGRKAFTPSQSKDMIVLDDDKPKQSAVEKSPKTSSIGHETATTTTTASASNAASFKFGWKMKTAKPQLPGKPSVQSGPMPGRKHPAKGIIANFVHCKLQQQCVLCICFHVAFCCSKLT